MLDRSSLRYNQVQSSMPHYFRDARCPELHTKNVASRRVPSKAKPNTVNIFSAMAILWIMASTSTWELSVDAFTTATRRPTRRICECSLYEYKQYRCDTYHVKRHSSVPWRIPVSKIFQTFLDMSPRTNEVGDEEWDAVVAAFQMYKAAYGDLKIPIRFVVPDMPPWPKSAWGLELGQLVDDIRSMGKFIETNDSAVNSTRRQLLDRLGFAWSVLSEGANGAGAEDQPIQIDQIIAAVQAYQQNFDSVDVPFNFVIPDTEEWPEHTRGLPLGHKLQSIKQMKNVFVREKFAALGVKFAEMVDDESKQVAREPDSRHEDLESHTVPDITTLEADALRLGETASANDIRFQKVYVALATYKKLFGDLLVPQPFVVPKGSSEWPEETWGLRLGARVNAIRSQGTFVNNNPARKDLLDAVGFVWSPPKERRRGRKPRTQSDDLEFLEMQLDSSLSDDENRATGDSASNILDDDGSPDSLFGDIFDFGRDFDLPATERSSPRWNLDSARLPPMAAKAAEQDTGSKEEDYNPPRTLAESLSEATERALDVGIIVGVTPNKRVIKGKRDKSIPWFNDDFGDDFVFEDVVEALMSYKTIHGEFLSLVNSDFVVPARKEVTGFLDDDSMNMLDIDASSRAAAAIANFDEKGQNDRNDNFIATEIKRLRQAIDQPDESEREFRTTMTMEESTDQWAEHLAGMALGNIVKRIRDGSLEVKHLPERKAQLDAIGFDWGDPKFFIDVPFEKSMCAMYAYYLVRGDMFVHEDFIMPDEDPWPHALAGYELGKAVKRIRELQNFFEAYHPEKVGLLRMIDFVWFADTVALPLDPNEKEITPETLLLSAMGHPDYAKMIDIPMGLTDKIIADGPFVEVDDDPKLWWRKWHNWDYVKDYWYEQGRRDNAYVLRKMGYAKMAEEHEAKYGPGLFAQLDDTLQHLYNTNLDKISIDEKRSLLEKLNFFRQEMLGCTDIPVDDRNKVISNLDVQMLFIMKNISPEMVVDQIDNDVENLFEYFEGEGNQGLSIFNNNSKRSVVKDDPNLSEEEQVFDIEDELGLGDTRL